MYATCLFCDARFRANEEIEAMPVGRRLAFDLARGRLWVVCSRCQQWNLAPLDERWEAIEACERLFRATRVRVSTDNVGLARLPGGTDLVRIGQPLRPEFAAWRYGERFARRRRQALALGAVGAVGAAAAAPVALAGVTMLGAVAFGTFMGPTIAPWISLSYTAAKEYLTLDRVVARVGTDSGAVRVRVRDLRESAVETDASGHLALHVTHDRGRSTATGAIAARSLGVLLAGTNALGANRRQVAEAVTRVGEAGGADAYLDIASRLSLRSGGRFLGKLRPVGAFNLTLVERLGLEMALHEESERRVLEGELAHLSAAWAHAEEIAEIADGL
jgi:hypothetical protein